MNSMFLTDGYKLDHRRQYPEGTELVYSNFTPRGSRIEGIDEVVFFGLQYICKRYFMGKFKKNFFDRPLDEVVKEYEEFTLNYLGPNQVGVDHIADLHKLGYLPIEIKALPEGTVVPIKVPMFTIKNTLPEFSWIVNYLETIISNLIWMPCTSATIARQYRQDLDKWAIETGGDIEFVPFQGHDFSMRGLSGVEAAMTSGAGHLLSFVGTDSIPSIQFLRKYYNAEYSEMIGVSVAATEHSVMCMGGNDGEFETFKRLITEVYPSGIVSIVSDTWDLWEVLRPGGYMDRLKNEIMMRDGKVVIRPDSGDPVDIICGLEGKDGHSLIERGGLMRLKDNNTSLTQEVNDYEIKGVIELLYDIFGGMNNEKGYKQLDPHVGAIYGDSITAERANDICDRLEQKGFASTNIVFGIGSYTYQHNTRDTFGFAMKATYGEVNGEGREIFKDPITDDGTKKSAKGLLMVQKNDFNGKLELIDQVDWETEAKGELKTVFKDGELIIDQSLAEIREKLK